MREALVDTRAFEGNESIEVYADQENPVLVVLWEKWRARSDYDAYLAWRMETGLMICVLPTWTLRAFES